MRTSETIAAIAPALVTAQSGIKAAIKNAKNPHFNSDYADLEAVIDAVKSALNGAGISILQGVSGDEGGRFVRVDTRLLHTSGEWIEDSCIVPTSKADAQGAGSAITYGRRYGLQSLVGLPAEDDDGNAASQAAKASSPTRQPRKPEQPQASKPASGDPGNDTPVLQSYRAQRDAAFDRLPEGFFTPDQSERDRHGWFYSCWKLACEAAGVKQTNPKFMSLQEVAKVTPYATDSVTVAIRDWKAMEEGSAE
jgi:hypothetical protein